MPIQVITRHCKDFDIYTHPVDPAKSPYATNPGYPEKVAAFYKQLGVTSALWAFPAHQTPKSVPLCKPYEYVLQLDESRVIAYVNESTWWSYVIGECEDFERSITPVQYEDTSLIIPSPIHQNELHRFRRYDNTNGPDHFEIVVEGSFGDSATRARSSQGDSTMLYMVELHYNEDQREAVLRYFDKHGLTHYEQDITLQGAWVATQDRVAYLIAETDDPKNIAKAAEPLSAFGKVKFRAVIKAEQI